jgi:anti-anti-sigma regulatory factor
MIAANQVVVSNRSDRFSHESACRIADIALNAASEQTIVIDLSAVREAATAAFTRLVLPRQELLRSGRNLRLKGLHDRPAGLYQIIRLNKVLPCAESPTLQ